MGNFGEVFLGGGGNWLFCRKSLNLLYTIALCGTVAKFKIYQYILIIGSPNLMLIKVSHCTVIFVLVANNSFFVVLR